MLRIRLVTVSSLIIVVAATFFAQRESDQPDLLRPYTICEFDDGLKVVKSERLSRKEVFSRSVETADGFKEVTRIDSYRMFVAYPKTDAFANIRPEKSKPDGYAQDKENVIEDLRYSISIGKEMEFSEPRRAIYNGFESYGLNRRTVEVGTTVGIYVLFNDTAQTITTIYFFNASPKKRKFQTIEEWRALKENFLENYTRCINRNSNR